MTDAAPSEPPGNNHADCSEDPIATAVAAGVGIAQWYILSGTLDEMKQAFAIERAYIFMDGVQRDRTKPLNPGYTITIGFKNFGKTPAVVHEVSGTCKYFAEPPPPVLNVTIQLPMDLVVGRGEHAGDFPASLVATNDEIAKARSGSGSIRCIYNIDYSDVREIHHVAGVCLVYDFGVNFYIFCPEKQYHYKN
ncbi:MAG: hypothetical protein WA624_17025 [Methylocella sp.]